MIFFRFETLPNYKINAKKEVKILHDSNILIIQTDKPLYRGGETVKLRILQLKADLTPQFFPVSFFSILILKIFVYLLTFVFISKILTKYNRFIEFT